MATEQEAEKASGDRAALDDALNKLAALSGVGAERERLTQQLQHYALLKQKYAQKSTALKEVRERLWAVCCAPLPALAEPLHPFARRPHRPRRWLLQRRQRTESSWRCVTSCWRSRRPRATAGAAHSDSAVCDTSSQRGPFAHLSCGAPPHRCAQQKYRPSLRWQSERAPLDSVLHEV